MPSPFTLIVPFYRQPLMLQRQVAELNQYPPAVQVIIVDDGSPEPAEPVIRAHASAALLTHLRLYRITVDVAWNREQCRNLGAQEAETEYIVQMDIDHVLPVACVHKLLAFQPSPNHWYRFPRWRVGQADETRKKDQLAPSAPGGPIHPHIDSYLVSKQTYQDCGGYNEAFSGVLGGGGEFLARLERTAGTPRLLHEDIYVQVHTRHAVPDASDRHCSRDTAPGKAIWRSLQAQGLPKPTRSLLQPWERVL